ncbi:penicillin acylase family protein [Vibrio sp. PP-XX7]
MNVNQGEPVKLTVQTSDVGPVFQTGMGSMAMHWVLSEPGAFDLQMMDLAQSNDAFEAMQVANHSGIPVQNLLVADVNGNIGWTLAGKLLSAYVHYAG